MSGTIPAVLPGVIAYLTVSDGAAAIAFYTRAFGGTELLRHLADDGKRILHARVAINGGLIMLSDDFPEMVGGKSRTPVPGQPRGIMLSVTVADCNTLFAQAVACGAEPLMQPADMFWGERYAQLRDPFGHEWSISSPLG